MTNPARLAIGDVPDWLQARGPGRVFIAMGPVEPVALHAAFSARPAAAAGLVFTGLAIPGINGLDWAGLHPSAGGEWPMPCAGMEASREDGRSRVLPVHWSAMWRRLCEEPFIAGVLPVTPPDAAGLCGLSLSADAVPALVARADVPLVGLVNRDLPDMDGAPRVPLSRFAALAETTGAPLAPPAAAAPRPAGAGLAALIAHAKAWVEDGATVQAGIGRLPAAVAAALADRRDLKIRSGLVGEWLAPLIAGGAVSDAPGSICTGLVWAGAGFTGRLARDPRLRLIPVSETHGAAALAATGRFTAINAALEVDLYGQINCEHAGARTVSGIGGALDFLRGARASPGGRPLVLIEATGRDGASRIVPRLSGHAVSIARADAPILVTAHGGVDLERLDGDARAAAIIDLADPAARPALEAAWADMRAGRA